MKYTVDYYRAGRRVDQFLVVADKPFDAAEQLRLHNRFYPQIGADAARLAR